MSAHDPIDPTRDIQSAREHVDEGTGELPPGRHETDPTSAMGGLGGAAIGAAAGSLGGPIGIAIGALAGAAGGWWAGRAISHAAHEYESEEPRFRERHAALEASHEYEAVRPAYQLGYLAGRNPEYRSKTFDDVEEHVQLGWSPIATLHGPWPTMREYARDAYGVGQEHAMIYEREVPISRGVESNALGESTVSAEQPVDLDEALAEAKTDPIAHPEEPAVAVYPTELDALANGIPAEPGSEAAKEFGISDAEARASEADGRALDEEQPGDRLL